MNMTEDGQTDTAPGCRQCYEYA